MKDLNTMRDSMERMLNESFVRFGGMLSSAAAGWMPIDVAESADGYLIWAAVPGVRPEDIHVTVQGSVVSISAQSRTELEKADRTWIVRERRTGANERSVTLPVAVDPDRVEARAENGLLVITLHRSSAPPARTISVGGGSAVAAPSVSPSASAPAESSPTAPSESPAVRATGDGDKVTEESEQSFPASDPPSWTPERA